MERKVQGAADGDEAGLLACQMIVDLNPVRAAMVLEPEPAALMSVYDRVRGEKGRLIDSGIVCCGTV